MGDYRPLMGLVSEIPTTVQFGYGKEPIKEAKFLEAKAIKLRLRYEWIDLGVLREELLAIAPEEANAYVRFKEHVEFYWVNPKVIEQHFNYISGNW